MITSVGFFTKRLSLFLSLKVNLDGDDVKDDGDVDTFGDTTDDNKTRILSSGNRKILSEDNTYGVGLQLNLD